MKRMVIILGSLVVGAGCAAPLTNLQQAETEYQKAEAARIEEQKAAEQARLKAEAAERAEAEKGKGLAVALVTDADERVRYVEQQLERARRQREKACRLNPDLTICEKEAKGPPQADSGPGQPPEAPPGEPQFVDVRVNDWSLSGLERLTDYPPGWKVRFESTGDGRIYVEIDGKRAYGYRKPERFASGLCYRFAATAATICPK